MSTISLFRSTTRLLAIFFMLAVFPVYAKPIIALSDFDLHDLTLLPGTKAERERVAGLTPLLEKSLQEMNSFEIIRLDPLSYEKHHDSINYLIKHSDRAAEAGLEQNADYVVVGQLEKPSFLFAYLKIHLINVATKKLISERVIEIKGPISATKLTTRGIQRLAQEIRDDIIRTSH